MDIQVTIQNAVELYSAETECLLPVVERRYDRTLFPSTGQYDWLSAQILYCLIRLLKPQAIIEVSTSSGYSTLIQATALKKNQSGVIHTFELDPRLAAAAGAAFQKFGVDDIVNVYVGDARVEADRLAQLPQPYILFLDSLHTGEFARWFIERWVVGAPPDTLFHVHDVMPPSARVRFDGQPPWRTVAKVEEMAKDVARRVAGRATSKDLGFVPPVSFPPPTQDELATTNGILYSEAVFINRVVGQMPAGSFVYLHDLIEQYSHLSPHRFNQQAIKRQSRNGQPMEWNESVWLLSGEIQKILSKI